MILNIFMLIVITLLLSIMNLLVIDNEVCKKHPHYAIYILIPVINLLMLIYLFYKFKIKK